MNPVIPFIPAWPPKWIQLDSSTMLFEAANYGRVYICIFKQNKLVYTRHVLYRQEQPFVILN
jgi:hypothetical protein